MLRTMQRKLAVDPRAGLGVAAGADASELRAAFLQLTKEFHPAKFARESPDVVRLSNEVFLSLREAYDQLAAAAKATPRAAPAARGSAPPPTAPASRPPQPSAPPAAAATAPASRPPQPSPAPTSRPAGANPAATATPPRGVPITPAAATLRSDPGRSAPVATGSGAGPRPQAPAPVSSTPTPNPAAAKPAATATAAATAAATAPKRPLVSFGGAPATRPAAAATVAQDGAARPPTAAAPVAAPAATRAAPAPTASSEEAEFAQAVGLLNQRRWKAAKAAFLALASRVPNERRYRAYLALARGLEAQDDNRHDEARAELGRALTFDPELAAARRALDVLEAASAGGDSSLLDRLRRK